jgi:hypothetical protein
MRSLALIAAVAGFAAAGSLQAAKPAPPAPAPSVDNVFWMVDCLIAGKNADLGKVLSTIPGDRASEMPWFHVAIGPCLVAEHPIPSASFYKRGAVAERLLYRDFPSIGAAPRRRPAPVFPAVDAAYVAHAEPSSLTTLNMLEATSCVVRADPARAYAFFQLQRGSAAETARVTEMVPALSACLTQGLPLKLTPAIFRAFLAEAAYRVAAGQAQVFEGGS